jgi:hypothetical protein
MPSAQHPQRCATSRCPCRAQPHASVVRRRPPGPGFVHLEFIPTPRAARLQVLAPHASPHTSRIITYTSSHITHHHAHAAHLAPGCGSRGPCAGPGGRTCPGQARARRCGTPRAASRPGRAGRRCGREGWDVTAGKSGWRASRATAGTAGGRRGPACPRPCWSIPGWLAGALGKMPFQQQLSWLEAVRVRSCLGRETAISVRNRNMVRRESTDRHLADRREYGALHLLGQRPGAVQRGVQEHRRQRRLADGLEGGAGHLRPPQIGVAEQLVRVVRLVRLVRVGWGREAAAAAEALAGL